MKAEKRGNFSVNGPGGITLVGFLKSNAKGKIIVTPNAPPIGISKSDVPTVIAAVQTGKKQVTINGRVLNVQITWPAQPRCM